MEESQEARKNILFVDDEACVLQGLRRMLRGQRKRWSMTFVGSGTQALEACQSEPFDVVVCDMRMPGMNGVEVLSQIRARHPASVRIVLSGHMESETAMRAVPVAHQFLAKPCTPSQIVATVERACNIQRVLQPPQLRDALGKLSALPSLPEVYHQLSDALQDSNASIRSIAQIVERDMAMCAKVLQLVNSAFFGLPGRVDRIERAVHYIGLQTLRALVLGASVFEAFEDADPDKGHQLKLVQHHAGLTAHLARHIMSSLKPERRDEAFLAGITHRVGALVWSRFPQVHGLLQCSPERAQAYLGGYLLGIWGLPYPIVEAVAYLHQPEEVEPQEFGLVTALHCASALAAEACGLEPCGEDGLINEALLERQGHGQHLEQWRATAQELLIRCL